MYKKITLFPRCLKYFVTNSKFSGLRLYWGYCINTIDSFTAKRPIANCNLSNALFHRCFKLLTKLFLLPEKEIYFGDKHTTPDSPKDCTESSLGLVDASYVVLHLEYSRKSKRYVLS